MERIEKLFPRFDANGHQMIKKAYDIAEEALRYIREMRDTWKEVMRKNNIYVA